MRPETTSSSRTMQSGASSRAEVTSTDFFLRFPTRLSSASRGSDISASHSDAPDSMKCHLLVIFHAVRNRAVRKL